MRNCVKEMSEQIKQLQAELGIYKRKDAGGFVEWTIEQQMELNKLQAELAHQTDMACQADVGCMQLQAVLERHRLLCNLRSAE